MKLHNFVNKFQIAISILAHTRTIHTKPISVPVVWPDSAGGSINSNREPLNYQNGVNRRIETINDRPSSDFNRLVYNRVGHNFQNGNAQDSVDYVDRTDRLTNNFAVRGGSGQNDRLVFDDAESRTKFLFKKKLKKRRKKICIPVGYGNGIADSLRTLYDINVIFADVNLNQYDTVGGYGCRPLYGLNSGHGTHGGHGNQGGHGSHGSNGGHISNNHASSQHGSNTDTDSDYDYVNQNDHGSLIQSEDYDHETSSSAPIQSSHGSNNLFGGLFHGTSSGSNNNDNYNNGNAHANGGPLGFFGQGGLFDFSNSGSQRPQSDATLGDSIDDTVRPIIEINVPDTIQDVVQGNWRPGNLVGGIQNSVSGFIQQISDRPGQTLREINQEISSIFRSFTDLF